MSGEKYHNFNALEAFRGVAALLVVICHLEFLHSGYLSVDFFFILSGFILSHRYIYGDAQISKTDFILKRLFRLYPMHLFSIVTLFIGFYCLLPTFTFDPHVIAQFVMQATLTQSLGFQVPPKWNFPNWSISVELWVSILMICLISQKKWVMGVLIPVALFCFLLLNSNTLNLTTENFYEIINGGFVRGATSFFIGALVYKAYHKIQQAEDNHLSRNANIYQAVFLILTIALYTICAVEENYYNFLAPLVFSGLVLSFAFENALLAKLVIKLRYLGKISFSLYLNHTLVIIVCADILGDLNLSKVTMGCVMLIVLILYSHLTYNFIEKPSKFYLGKLIKGNQHD